MRPPHFAPPLLVVVLSLGFLGQTPISFQEGSHRHISSCEDPALKPTSAALPTSLFSFVQDNNSRQSADAYALFLLAMQVNGALSPTTAPSRLGFGALPVDRYIAPVKPDLSTLAWGGGSLLTDPRLHYLIQPTVMTSRAAPQGSLDSLVDLPTIENRGVMGLSVGTSAAASNPAPDLVSSSGPAGLVAISPF